MELHISSPPSPTCPLVVDMDELYLCRSHACTVAVGSTQPLTEMSTEISPGGKGSRYVGLITLPSRADCLEILGSSTFWSLKSVSRPIVEYRSLTLAMPISYRRSRVKPPHFLKLWLGGGEVAAYGPNTDAAGSSKILVSFYHSARRHTRAHR